MEHARGDFSTPHHLARSVRQPNSRYSTISTAVPTWSIEVSASYEGDQKVQQLLTALTLQPTLHSHYSYQQGILRYKGRLYIGNQGPLRQKLMQQMHDSSLGGHSGIDNSYRRMKQLFFWPGMRIDIEHLVKECEICIKNKVDGTPYAGLLQPLPIPKQAWQVISMDFIEALPRSESNDTILVVVDKFTKYAHFLSLSHPYTASDIAKLFFDSVYKLHGLPEGIISDRDKIFTSQFWQDLFRLMGVQLQMSIAYHPQSDGQTERVNRCLETYLRCMCFHRPRGWHKWLSLAEWWYNTSHHSSIGMSPFQALYGYVPPTNLAVHLNKTLHASVEDWKTEREQMMQILRGRLQEAQNRMKQYADKKRVDKEYSVGEKVYLKLQPYRQHSVVLRKNLKLTSRYFCPYEILEKVGPVAYRLLLPEGSKIHPVFHVSQLKGGVKRQEQLSPVEPVVGPTGELMAQPEQILSRRLVQRGGRAVSQVLVTWSNLRPEEATWEDYWKL